MQRWTVLPFAGMTTCGVCEIELEPVAAGYEVCAGCSTVTASVPIIRLT